MFSEKNKKSKGASEYDACIRAGYEEAERDAFCHMMAVMQQDLQQSRYEQMLQMLLVTFIAERYTVYDLLAKHDKFFEDTDRLFVIDDIGANPPPVRPRPPMPAKRIKGPNPPIVVQPNNPPEKKDKLKLTRYDDNAISITILDLASDIDNYNGFDTENNTRFKTLELCDGFDLNHIQRIKHRLYRFVYLDHNFGNTSLYDKELYAHELIQYYLTLDTIPDVVLQRTEYLLKTLEQKRIDILRIYDRLRNSLWDKESNANNLITYPFRQNMKKNILLQGRDCGIELPEKILGCHLSRNNIKTISSLWNMESNVDSLITYPFGQSTKMSILLQGRDCGIETSEKTLGCFLSHNNEPINSLLNVQFNVENLITYPFGHNSKMSILQQGREGGIETPEKIWGCYLSHNNSKLINSLWSIEAYIKNYIRIYLAYIATEKKDYRKRGQKRGVNCSLSKDNDRNDYLC